MAEVLCVSVALASALRDRGEERKEAKTNLGLHGCLPTTYVDGYMCVYIYMVD